MPAATASPAARAIASQSAPALGWDGDALPDGADYDDYLTALPSREELKPFAAPVLYWEVRYPGCALQPYPRMGAFRSSDSGVWQAVNAAQESAIREHLRQSAGVDPDELKLTDAEIAVATGKAKGPRRFCQNCHAVYGNLAAADLHETLCGHLTAAEPRKD